MDRVQILAMVDVAHARGLEIGPLHKPVVARALGPVEYVDRASREELQRWYATDPAVDVDAIVEVDHVWGEQSLLECVGGERVYDYLVASHVIEHVPDLFGWLGEIAAVLKDGGVAFFAVPDKRYTFDGLRRTSSESELVDAYVRRLRRPDPRQIFDHLSNVRETDAAAIWKGAAASTPPSHPAAEILAFARAAHESGEYIDAHCWVFTPRSMVEALDLGSRLGLLPYEIAALEPTETSAGEFMMALRRLPEALDTDSRRAAFVRSTAALSLPAELQAEASADTLLARAIAAEAQVNAIKASTSWKLTAPLRAAVTWARGLRG